MELTVVVSQSRQYVDLSTDFIFIDREGKPSIALNTQNIKSLGFYLEQSRKFDSLILDGQNPFSVWINGQLIAEGSNSYALSKRDLSIEGQMNLVYISVFSDKSLHLFSAKLLSLGAATLKPFENQNRYQTDQVVSLFVVSMLVFVFGYSFAGRSTGLGLGKLLFVDNRYRQSNVSLQQSGELISIGVSALFVSLLMGYLHLLYVHGDDLYFDRFLVIVTSWVYYTVISFAILIAKYVIILTVSRLFHIQSVKDMQFGNFLNFLLIALGMTTFIIQVKFWSNYSADFGNLESFQFFYIVSYSLFLFYMFIKLITVTSFRKLHIIAYLCATEIVWAFALAILYFK